MGVMLHFRIYPLFRHTTANNPKTAITASNPGDCSYLSSVALLTLSLTLLTVSLALPSLSLALLIGSPTVSFVPSGTVDVFPG